MPIAPCPQTLLFDADDTLWENNIYFERAIADFISYLDHRVHSPAEVRSHLNTCERATIAQHGYGVRSFRRSLIACFEELSDAPLTPEKEARILAFADVISAQELVLLPDVETILSKLARRHRLLFVTKGDPDEQISKLERSGVATFFTAVEVPREKEERVYRDLMRRHQLEPAHTWMIGNSPRSDINPALAAGLNAVFIPHASTWALEHETLCDAGTNRRLLRLDRFAQLLDHF